MISFRLWLQAVKLFSFFFLQRSCYKQPLLFFAYRDGEKPLPSVSPFGHLLASNAVYFDEEWRTLPLEKCLPSSVFVFRGEANFGEIGVSLVLASWLFRHVRCAAKPTQRKEGGKKENRLPRRAQCKETTIRPWMASVRAMPNVSMNIARRKMEEG